MLTRGGLAPQPLSSISDLRLSGIGTHACPQDNQLLCCVEVMLLAMKLMIGVTWV